jgi:hypothetical protein
MRTDDIDDFEYAKIGKQTAELLMGDGESADHKVWAENDPNVSYKTWNVYNVTATLGLNNEAGVSEPYLNVLRNYGDAGYTWMADVHDLSNNAYKF